MRIWVFISLLIPTFFAFGCNRGSSPEDPNAPYYNEEITTKTIEAGTLGSSPFEKLEIQWSPTDSTFALWLETTLPTAPNGVALVVLPYNLVKWSSDKKDQSWIEKFRDRWGHFFEELTASEEDLSSNEILGAESQIPSQQSIRFPIISQSDFELSGVVEPLLINGYSVLIVFPRFYQGRSLKKESRDIQASLRFIAKLPTEKRKQVLALSESWGSSTLLAALSSKKDLGTPITAMALTSPWLPPSIQKEYSKFIREQNLPSAQKQELYSRLLPMARKQRLSPEVAQLLEAESLNTKLTTPTLLLQDETDTLAPIPYLRKWTHGLDSVETLWLKSPNYQFNLNGAPISHGLPGSSQSASTTTVSYQKQVGALFTLSFLFANSTRGSFPWSIPYSPNALEKFLTLTRAKEELPNRPAELKSIAKRLLALASRDFVLFDSITLQGKKYGDEWLVYHLNRVWGLNLSLSDWISRLESW